MEFTRFFEPVLASRIREKLNTIQVIIGPRQVGKTTGVTHVFNEWPHAKIMASADLPAPPDSQWIVQHWNAARAMEGEVLLVFDEVQKVPHWSDTIKMLFDKDRSSKRLRVVLLGSASLSLGQGLKETLTGRFELIPVPHWSYSEFKQAFGWPLERYLSFGGYPAAAEFANDPDRWQLFVRNSIVEPTLSKDIFGLVTIKKPTLFRQVFELVMHHPSQILSYQKFVGQLQESGNISTIQHYLEILEQAFLLKRLQVFSRNIIRQKASTPKLIPLCPALIHAFIDPIKAKHDPAWRGRLLEVMIGTTLISTFREVSYWRRGHDEIDFVVQHDERVYAVEVKSGSARKGRGMSRFLKEYPEAIPVIIDAENVNRFLEDPARLSL